MLFYTVYETSEPAAIINISTLIVPNPPSNLTAEAMHSDEILLNWTDTSNNEVGFEIFRQEGNSGTMDLLTTLNADVNTHPDAPLSPGTTYYYQVRAINTDGESAFSNKASATTPLENQVASVI